MTESIPRLLGAVSGLIATRFRLLGIELEEELERMISLALLLAAAAVFASMFLLVLTLLIMVVFWDDYRITAAVVLAGIYGGLGLACLLGVRRVLRRGGTPFATVAREFERDQSLLAGRQEGEEA